MKVNVYCDETYIEKKGYMGIGCLIIPNNKKDRLYNELSKIRCLNENSDNWEWNFNKCIELCDFERHKNNNCEIHHKKIVKKASSSKKEISKKWIKLLLRNNRHNQEMIYFKILYIDLNKLNSNVFGDTQQKTNIYNRFFRTTLSGAFKYFFNNEIEVENIYHDESDDKEQHDYFPWHLTHKIKNEISRVKMECDEIMFLDSDHKTYLKSDESMVIHSQFIQFIDLILGTVSQTLFKTSNDPEKQKLSEYIYPLVERLINAPKNKNSSYHYHRKQDISIFPENEIHTEYDLYDNKIRIGGEFHRNIILEKPSDPQQQSLFDFK